MLWTDCTVHVIDFEGSVRTGIVEFGVVTLQGGRIEFVVTKLCRPRKAVPEDERRVHGLATGDLGEAQPFEDEWPRFAELRQTGVFAAHFCAAEDSMLRSYWPCPRLSPDWLEPGREVAEWGPWIDTGRLAAQAAPTGESVALEDLIARYGQAENLAALAREHCPEERRHFHCALFDALGCALLLRTFASEIAPTPWSLARLLAASTANPVERDRHSQPRLPGF